MGLDNKDLSAESFKSGTLEKICDLARSQCNISFSVIFPKSDGWSQVDIGAYHGSSGFCKVIQGSKEGAKHCRMCHVLMTVAACSQGMTEQKCHAGATVLIQPIQDAEVEGMALLSSCAFRSEEKEKAWEAVRKRAIDLGLDVEDVKREFEALPDLDEARTHCLRMLMPLAVEAVKEINRRVALERELAKMRTPSAKNTPGALLKQEFREAASQYIGSQNAPDFSIGNLKGKKTPNLVQIVCSLVKKRPQVPYTVEELATAARMTPNYFSSIFHKHTGQCFMDYLTDCRLARAQELLADLSLNISEVASKCGYDDPGYFTRRFKKKTGMTPRAWREKI